MKFRNDTMLMKCIVLMVAFLIVMALHGCAPMTEQYWEERYAAMTPEEIEEAKANGGELVQVCNLTDCLTVWVY